MLAHVRSLCEDATTALYLRLLRTLPNPTGPGNQQLHEDVEFANWYADSTIAAVRTTVGSESLFRELLPWHC